MNIMDEHILRAKEIYKDIFRHRELRGLPEDDKKFVVFIASVLSQNQNSAFVHSNAVHSNDSFQSHTQVPVHHLNRHIPIHGHYPHSFVAGHERFGVYNNHKDIKTPFITLNAHWFFDNEPDISLSEANKILKCLPKEWKIKEYYVNGIKSLFSGKVKISQEQFNTLADEGCISLIYRNSKGRFLRVEIDLKEGTSEEERPSMIFFMTSYYPEFNQEIHSLEYDFLGQAKKDFVLVLNQFKDTIKDGSWMPDDIEVYEAADWNGKIDCRRFNELQ